MPTLIIDGKEISVQPGATIMEAARLLGVYIPHFCYHPQLSIAGNCRMCLVEVEKMPRPVVSCAMPVSEGMVVKTDSEMVRKGRQAVMEFLLINHPLDCPVCDQGGECSLQDLAMKYGPDRSRYYEQKRHAHDYDLGPLLETEMNRCIHCTRCIRFTDEIAGAPEMGAVYRGDHMQVGPYSSRPLSSELTGNLAEICPVGALNNKPFHFQARGWELKKSDGICAHCAVGCHQRIDHLNNEVKRVMSRRCLEINQTWLCDKGRFAYDGLTRNRLEQPMIRSEESNQLVPASWAAALDRAAELLKHFKPEEVAGLASEAGQGAEELYAFQDFLRNVVGTAHLDHRLRQRDFSADEMPLTRADLSMNTPLSQMGKADLILLIG
ncbi:NADH-quinone oxidoreductase subunit NuoG, partial [Candidatus Magnetaquicoccus inordinatus]|uniref:NADH-quinone oxidoreductase subunit NuoG n=1 Tax=Candidatus Magnetaquicoccus inordinatus TaxID=2496818 RepID=UPI00187D48C0